MNDRTLEVLQLMIESGTPAFQQRARQLIQGAITMTDDELSQFIDGFLNDPYLTRF